MSKKKHARVKHAQRVPKTGPVWHLSAEEAALAKKPRYNGYACGYGAHGDAKCHRAKAKRAWNNEMRCEGTPRGSFLLAHRRNLLHADIIFRILQRLLFYPTLRNHAPPAWLRSFGRIRSAACNGRTKAGNTRRKGGAHG